MRSLKIHAKFNVSKIRGIFVLPLITHIFYSQGAFYVLGEHLVSHLNRSRDLLVTMSVEDAMVGTWLPGYKKV